MNISFQQPKNFHMAVKLNVISFPFSGQRVPAKISSVQRLLSPASQQCGKQKVGFAASSACHQNWSICEFFFASFQNIKLVNLRDWLTDERQAE